MEYTEWKLDCPDSLANLIKHANLESHVHGHTNPTVCLYVNSINTLLRVQIAILAFENNLSW